MGLQYMGKPNDNNRTPGRIEGIPASIPQTEDELRQALGDKRTDDFLAAEQVARELVTKLLLARHVAQSGGGAEALQHMMEYATELRRFIGTKSEEEVGVLFTTVASAIAGMIEKEEREGR